MLRYASTGAPVEAGLVLDLAEEPLVRSIQGVTIQDDGSPRAVPGRDRQGASAAGLSSTVIDNLEPWSKDCGSNSGKAMQRRNSGGITGEGASVTVGVLAQAASYSQPQTRRTFQSLLLPRGG